MSTWEKALDVADALKAAVHGLNAIGLISDSPAHKASEALSAITAIVEVVKEGLAGKTTPEVVLAEIRSLHARLAMNDAEADAALKAKFPSK